MDAAPEVGAGPGELWRHTSPYRGLAAMEGRSSDYFFGRGRETAEVIDALTAPGQVARPARQFGGRQILARAGGRAGCVDAAGLDQRCL